METYVRPSAAILPQSGTAPQGIGNICSLRAASPPTGKHTFPRCQCPRMLETYVRPSAAILPQSGTAPQGIRNICSLRAASSPTGKHTFPHCQCPRMLETYVRPSAAILPQSGTALQAIENIRSPDRPTHQQRQPPRARLKTSVPQSHSPATSTYANNPRTTPSQMLKHMFSQLAQLPETPRPAVTSQKSATSPPPRIGQHPRSLHSTAPPPAASRVPPARRPGRRLHRRRLGRGAFPADSPPGEPPFRPQAAPCNTDR